MSDAPHIKHTQKCARLHNHNIRNYPECIRIRCACGWTSDWVDFGFGAMMGGYTPQEELDYKWEVHVHIATRPDCECPMHRKRRDDEVLW